MQTVKAKPLIHLISATPGKIEITESMVLGFGYPDLSVDESSLPAILEDLKEQAKLLGLRRVAIGYEHEDDGNDHDGYYLSWW